MPLATAQGTGHHGLAYDFDPGTGFLPPGRYSCTRAEAYAFLVTNPRFSSSSTRQKLWDSLQTFLSEFVYLEEQYKDVLPGRLLDRVWIAGSFVSAKVDPRNTDVTLVLHEDAMHAVRGKPGAGILRESRDHWLNKYSVSPVTLKYRPVASPFQNQGLTQEDWKYYQDRGSWDDWWQRTRDSGPRRSPDLTTAVPRRGYLEVALDD